MVPVLMIMAGGAMVAGGPVLMKLGHEQLKNEQGLIPDVARAALGVLLKDKS